MLFTIFCLVSMWKPRRVFAMIGGAKIFCKRFTFSTSLFGSRKLTFCIKNTHYLIQSEDGKISIHSNGVWMRPTLKIPVGEKMQGEQQCQCPFTARRAHIVWNWGWGKPGSPQGQAEMSVCH